MLLLGAAAGLTAAACTIGVCALTLRSPDYGVFRQPTFYAHGGDLPRLLELSDRLTSAGDSYQSSYQQALSGLDTLVAAAAGDRTPAVQRSFMVASDIHANWLTLPAFARYADHRPVFLVGDFALQGTPIEASIARRAAHLGQPTVVVSGNHDSPVVMRRLAQAGAIVLTHAGRMAGDGTVTGPTVVPVDGLMVAGYEDPLAEQAGNFGHRLDLTPDELISEIATVETGVRLACRQARTSSSCTTSGSRRPSASTSRPRAGASSSSPATTTASTSTEAATSSRSMAARSGRAASSRSATRPPASPRCTSPPTAGPRRST